MASTSSDDSSNLGKSGTIRVRTKFPSAIVVASSWPGSGQHEPDDLVSTIHRAVETFGDDACLAPLKRSWIGSSKHEIAMSDAVGRDVNRTTTSVMTLRLRDAEGHPVTWADLVAVADQGVSVAPFRETDAPGAYTTLLRWPPGVATRLRSDRALPQSRGHRVRSSRTRGRSCSAGSGRPCRRRTASRNRTRISSRT